MVRHIIPKTYREALEHLKSGSLHILAGGTDLMVQNRAWSETPVAFKKDTLYVYNLEELRYIEREGDMLHVGALASYDMLERHPDTPSALKRCIALLASPGLRRVATLAGNIGNASPAADGVLVLYALDARVVLDSADATREIPIEEAITGPGRTAFEDGEMIREIRIPLEDFDSERFKKVGGRKADAISKVSFLGAAAFDGDVIKDLRLALGAVNTTVVRRREIEAQYQGLTAADLKARSQEIREAYAPYVRPIDDQRSTATYRRQVALNLIEDYIHSL